MLPTSMKGNGYYKAHSLIQRDVIELSLPLIAEATSRIPLPGDSEPFCMVDYGCGQGKNSIVPIEASMEGVRARRPDQDFCVIHNDLPSNDFNTLFQDVHGDRQESYLRLSGQSASDRGRIFVLGSATSFYQQVAPTASVHLGFSSSAMHWLSGLPDGIIKHDIWSWGASSAEIKFVARQAAKDWQTILERRAREMRPGARLIVTKAGALTEDESRKFAVHRDLFSAYQPTRLLSDTLKDMVQEGLIDAERFERFCFPFFWRTVEELVAPIEEKGSPLHELLEVEHASAIPLKCPFYERLGHNGNLSEYVDELIATVRAFTEPMVVTGLLANHCEPASNSEGSLNSQRHKLIDEIYDRMKVAATARPDACAFNVVQLMLVVRRK